MTKREMLKELKNELKELVVKQIEDKRELRKPHIGRAFSSLMSNVDYRRGAITAYHNYIDDMRGKPRNQKVNDQTHWPHRSTFKKLNEKYPIQEPVMA